MKNNFLRRDYDLLKKDLAQMQSDKRDLRGKIKNNMMEKKEKGKYKKSSRVGGKKYRGKGIKVSGGMFKRPSPKQE